MHGTVPPANPLWGEGWGVVAPRKRFGIVTECVYY